MGADADGALRARLLVLAAAALFSTGGAIIKALPLDGWEVASLRSCFAVVAVLAFLPAARRVPGRATWIAALPYAATMMLFVTANKLTTAANTIFLQSTAPLYLLLLGPWLLGEPVRKRDVGLVLVFAVGLAAFLLDRDPRFATAPDPARGNALAAASGLAWALTVVSLRRVGREGGAGAASTLVAGNVVVALVGLPLALPLGAMNAGDWLLVAFLGVVQIAVAYTCLVAGLRRVTALEGSLLILLEPVLNPVWTWLVHGEVPGPWSLVGAAILLAATIGQISERRGR